jgi:hypothetical protein
MSVDFELQIITKSQNVSMDAEKRLRLDFLTRNTPNFAEDAENLPSVLDVE